MPSPLPNPHSWLPEHVGENRPDKESKTNPDNLLLARENPTQLLPLADVLFSLCRAPCPSPNPIPIKLNQPLGTQSKILPSNPVSFTPASPQLVRIAQAYE